MSDQIIFRALSIPDNPYKTEISFLSLHWFLNNINKREKRLEEISVVKVESPIVFFNTVEPLLA